MSMKPEQSSGELAGLFIRIGNMFFQVAAAGDSCDESLSDKAIPLYTVPPASVMKHQITASMAKDIAFKLGAELNDDEAEIFADGYNAALLKDGNSPVVKFDNRYITTRLEAFEDTYEIVDWLERMADGCCDPDEKYSLKETATSLYGMYVDLKEFGEALMQIQGKPEPEACND